MPIEARTWYAGARLPLQVRLIRHPRQQSVFGGRLGTPHLVEHEEFGFPPRAEASRKDVAATTVAVSATTPAVTRPCAASTTAALSRVILTRDSDVLADPVRQVLEHDCAIRRQLVENLVVQALINLQSLVL